MVKRPLASFSVVAEVWVKPHPWKFLLMARDAPKRTISLLVSLGDQCLSGTSLKMVMDKVSKTGLVTFLDDGRMTATLAEFLLQLQGGLMQGSSTQGAFPCRTRHMQNLCSCYLFTMLDYVSAMLCSLLPMY